MAGYGKLGPRLTACGTIVQDGVKKIGYSAKNSWKRSIWNNPNPN